MTEKKIGRNKEEEEEEVEERGGGGDRPKKTKHLQIENCFLLN
jgi:hypothetical protein